MKKIDAGHAASLNELLKRYVFEQGASLFGVADISGLGERHNTLSPETRQGLDRGVAVAFHLSDRIFEDLTHGPTRLYFFHYQRVNIFLDTMGLKITNFIQSLGWDALPIPASQVVDWEKQQAHVSHKHVAVQAGIGWIGRNNLLVSPQFGSRLRLMTVLTDMPLKVDEPIPWGCGSCQACIPACPSHSIKEKPEDFDHQGCYQQIRGMVKAAGISQNICGLCIKTCRGKKEVSSPKSQVAG
jgi:epoxyqueuosine reductase